jgi:hypothetical protein
MMFTLDEHLEPQEMYSGIEFDQKSMVITLQEEDLEETSPAAWKSRPLKIHPEPATRLERRASDLSTGTALSTAGALVRQTSDASGARAASPTSVGSPRNGPSASPQLSQKSEADVGSGPALSPRSGPQPDPGSTASGSQSPKIVISNVQLESLKKKMEFLKQKKMALPPSAAAAAAEDKSEENRKLPPVTSNCPGHHGLKHFKTPDDGWWCSVCEKEHPKDSSFFGCRACDYDECETCARAVRPAKTSESSKPKAKTSKEKESPKEKEKERETKESKRSKSKASSADDSSEERSPSPKAVPKKANKEKEKEKRREASPATTPTTKQKKRRDEPREESDRHKKEARSDRKEATPKESSTKASPKESSTKASPREKKRAGAKLAAAALAAANERDAGSDEASSSEEEYRQSSSAPLRRSANTRESKVERRQAQQPERWEPRSKKAHDAKSQDAQEDSEPSDSPPRGSGPGAALAAAVRNAAASNRRGNGAAGVRLERRGPPERQAPSKASRSRDRGSSEEPPPKKRASSGNSAVAADFGGSAGSSSSLRRYARDSPEAPRAAQSARGRAGDDGANLLRRVLQGNRAPPLDTRASASRPARPLGIAGAALAAVGRNAFKEPDSPGTTPSRRKEATASPEAKSVAQKPARGPGMFGGLQKALADIHSQEDGRGPRRAR